MSKTDKDKPFKFRLAERGHKPWPGAQAWQSMPVEERTGLLQNHIETMRSMPTKHDEQGVSPQQARFEKRARSKRNRRAKHPERSMSGRMYPW